MINRSGIIRTTFFHSTTRGTIRLVHTYRDQWLIFFADGYYGHDGTNYYSFSSDGLHWSPNMLWKKNVQKRHPENYYRTPYKSGFGRSVVVLDDDIYSFSYSDTDNTRKLAGWGSLTNDIRKGKIINEEIKWVEEYKRNFGVTYYPDLQLDSTGRFTATGRTSQLASPVGGVDIIWTRTKRREDISEWQDPVRCINHTSDFSCSEVHENIVMEDGMSYVFGTIGLNRVGMLYGNRFDGEEWGKEDVEISNNMQRIRGGDMRINAVWDPNSKTIHLIYVERDGKLWHRTCSSPYYAEDWSEPEQLLSGLKLSSALLGIDIDEKPSHLWLCYCKTKFEGKDQRVKTGEIYIQESDGQEWLEPILMSEPGTIQNWYPNMNLDASKGIGVLYLKTTATLDKPGPHKSGTNINEIMFATTGLKQ